MEFLFFLVINYLFLEIVQSLCLFFWSLGPNPIIPEMTGKSQEALSEVSTLSLCV